MNAAQTVTSIRRGLKKRHLQRWMLLSFLSIGYAVAISWVISFFSKSGSIAFLTVSGIAFLIIAYWKGCFRRFLPIDAARYLDNALQSKDRFVSFVELAPVDEPGKLEFLASQLDNFVKSSSVGDFYPPLQIPRHYYSLLSGLAIPLLLGIALFQRQAMAPVMNGQQVALIDSVLQNSEHLPPELAQKLGELKDALQENPLLDAPVSDALAEADNKLEELLSSEASKGNNGRQEKIVEEPTPTPAPADPAAPSPTPTATPTPSSSQSEQQKKDEDKQKQQEQQQNQQSQEQKQDQKSKEGQGKGGKQQSQSQQSQSAQGNGQGQGNAEGQGQGQQQQQGGQGSGEKQSESKQENSSAQGQQDGKGKGQSSADNKDSKEGEGESNSGKEGAEKKSDKQGDDKGKEGDQKSPDNKGDKGLGDAKAALDQIKKDINKEKGDGKQEGKDKGKENNKDKEKGNEGQQGQGDNRTESEKQPQNTPNKDDTDSQKEKGQQGGKSALPAPGEKGSTPEPNAGVQGTKEQERSRSTDVNVPPQDEQFDTKFAEKEGEAVQNKKAAVPKTGLADVQLAKPESRGGNDEQYIPPEYESILPGR